MSVALTIIERSTNIHDMVQHYFWQAYRWCALWSTIVLIPKWIMPHWIMLLVLCSTAGKVTIDVVSHWPCITYFIVYPPTGLVALTGRWAPRLCSRRAWPALPFCCANDLQSFHLILDWNRCCQIRLFFYMWLCFDFVLIEVTDWYVLWGSWWTCGVRLKLQYAGSLTSCGCRWRSKLR